MNTTLTKIELLKGTRDQQVTDALPLSASLDTPGRIEIKIAGYVQTVFEGYRLTLGAPLPAFPALEQKRTVWLPAYGFKDNTWHDGPLVVTEADGTVSNYIPTGTTGSLLLAPDNAVAKGWDAKRASTLEGARGEQLLRGCIAAIRARTADTGSGQMCLRLSDDAFSDLTPDHVLVRLAVLRAAVGPERGISILHAADIKLNPRLRRFCEHTSIELTSWDEPDADLDMLFSWFALEWADELLAAINAHGDIIPA